MTCSDPSLPTDESNLVHRAALLFLEAAGLADGVRLHLEKQLPLAAGLGGGSANAAVTLLGLNTLFDQPLTACELHRLAADLGSDVPFFLQSGPAIGTGRGEQIQPVAAFESLTGCWLLLIRPGFGVSTPWAYRHLQHHPEAMNRRSVNEVITALRSGDPGGLGSVLFNSLEAPVFAKFPWLAALKSHLMDRGASAALMSGSGSTTFSITRSRDQAEALREEVLTHFGRELWTAVAPL